MSSACARREILSQSHREKFCGGFQNYTVRYYRYAGYSIAMYGV